MSWLRPAALYLTLTALIGGSIWLFWGKTIEQKWRQLSSESARAETRKNRLPEKKIRASDRAEPPKSGLTASPREEWQKTRSGLIALIAIEAEDNRRQLVKLGEFNDNRWYAILRRPKPATEMQPAQHAAKPEPVKPAERQPSMQKVKR